MTELFKTEPLQNVGFLALASELHRCPFGVKVIHCVLPGLSGVGVEFPTMLLFGSSPVRDFESFKQSTRLSVETDITYAFEYGGGVEVLGIHVIHDVGFFVEFVAVNIFNSQAYIIIN